MRLSKASTINDVARLSGVSHQTVSRVINEHPNVAPKTRKRVLEVIQELGYQPNRAARHLVTGKSNTVGLVSYGTSHYGPARMVNSIDSALRDRDIGLVSTHLREMTLSELEHSVSYLKSQLVEGLILISPLDIDVEIIRKLCQPLPFVTLDVAARKNFPSIAIDQYSGARKATEHLLELGHRSIAHISGPLHWTDAKLRQQGWQDSLSDAKLQPDNKLKIEGDWTSEGGYAACKKLLSSSFSALFVGNDQMALGAIHALHEHGLSVPEDISIVGFDDIPEAAFFYPPLTTVQQNFTDLGKQSVSFLLDLLANNQPEDQTPINPKLIVRESTKRIKDA
ncbi:MAG: LacI family DNA-binding transcriptional regulator [Trueperaceae bacterium]|nr:LacI family DNA-binding transcriptional regulator [Trueperaceae bacterium]